MSGSWYPLAWTDPVPGDPVAVRAAGQEYTAVAERIAQAAGDLRTLTAGITQTSQAVEQMQARAAETAERISTAHDRYQATGTALVDYADALDHAQGLARDALDTARRAARAIDTADADVRRWATQALDETDTARAASYEHLAETARHTREIAGALQLARDIYLALTTDTGWGDVALGALGMITFGIGRLSAQGLRIATNTARAHQGLRTLPVTGQATASAARATRSATGAADSAGGRAAPAALHVRTWTTPELWSTVRPSAIAQDVAGDLKGLVTALKDPGVFATRGPGRHVSRPIDVLENAIKESTHNLRNTTAGAERLTALLGDLESARDIRFLVEHGADLGYHGATLRTWAAGRGALQVLDIGLVAESLTPKGTPS